MGEVGEGGDQGGGHLPGYFSMASELGKYRTRDTKFFKTIWLYWKIKSLLVKVLLEHEEEKKEILLQLDKLQEHYR